MEDKMNDLFSGYPDMDPGFSQFCALSEEEFIRGIRQISAGARAAAEEALFPAQDADSN